MAQHTPEPWRSTGRNITKNGEEYPAEVLGPNGELITRMFYIGPDGEANAEFLARACNSHDELLEALTTLLDKVDRKRYNIRSDFDFFAADAAARAAIAKATGG